MIDNTQETVTQNLKDAGCSQEIIAEFLEFLRQGKTDEQLRLLDKVHAEEKKIDCLDDLARRVKQKKILFAQKANVSER